MNKIILFSLIAVFIAQFSYASINCYKHPIYCQILKNKPDIDKDYAMKLSSLIFKYASKYKINPRIFAAILAQESRYNLEAKNCKVGVKLISREEYVNKIKECEINNEYSDNCIENIEKKTEETICFDYGIGQINYKTAEENHIDLYKLTTDLEYSVEMSAKLLSYLRIKYESKEPVDWFTRYNSATREIRDEYEKVVKRWM